MLLRRVIEHVREQNWAAVGIDFVIVVVGVFVGIQVANWNTERETRHKSAVFTERLLDDLRREAQRRAFQSKYYDEVRAAGETAAAALAGTSPLSNGALLVHAYRATQYWQTPSQRATYDELVSTGNIGLITDRRLVALAVSTFGNSFAEDMRIQRDDSPYRTLFRMSIPIDLQRALARQCGDRFTPDREAPVLDYPCEPELEASALDTAADALRKDPETLRLLHRRLADIDTLLGDISRKNRDLRQGLATIAGDAP